MKRCGRCKESLPVAAFHASTRSMDGLQSSCKQCQADYRRQRVAEKRQQIRAALTDGSGLKHCPRCDRTLERSEFHRNKSSSDGLQGYCKECSALFQAAYLKRHAEAVAAKQAERLLRGAQEPVGVKTCNKCGQTKPLLSFYLHRSTRDGRATYCADCQRASTRAWNAANRDRIKERNATYAAENPDRQKRDHRQFWLKMYGLDQASYEAMLEAQGGVCAICQQPERYIDSRSGLPRRLAVDHCHASGKVRGLLCGHCNRGIGQFEDDHERLSRAATYLREVAI